jgi:hypothetical protein
VLIDLALVGLVGALIVRAYMTRLPTAVESVDRHRRMLEAMRIAERSGQNAQTTSLRSGSVRKSQSPTG